MRILNFGSLNLDHVYRVDHFLRPGETSASLEYRMFCGGKGLNQSIALANAGAAAYHAGKVGTDGDILLRSLRESGVDTRFVSRAEGSSGHAIIQVDRAGDNCILLHGGANRLVDEADIATALAFFSSGDILLLQNEIAGIGRIMALAAQRGMTIVFNPAPMDAAVSTYPLDLVDVFIVNEVEGRDLTGAADPDLILSLMRRKFPNAAAVLTLGAKGIRYRDAEREVRQDADASVKVVDTTAAGDTFIGYFVAGLAKSLPIAENLRIAAKACDICVSRPGASASIPKLAEL